MDLFGRVFGREGRLLLRFERMGCRDMRDTNHFLPMLDKATLLMSMRILIDHPIIRKNSPL